MKKLTNKDFIEKAKIIHKNKYDYSMVNYVNNKTGVLIICRKHGKWTQQAGGHLGGRGCPVCGVLKNSISRTRTQDEFIKAASNIHATMYDYSKVNYINAHVKITIICKKHGEFEQEPNNHLRGMGCHLCKKEAQKLTTKEFIKRAKEIHGNKYDYFKSQYKDNKTKIIIICKKHGEFEQLPGNHLKGCICQACCGNYLSNTKEFIEKSRKIYGDKYDYSKVDYKTRKGVVRIICKKHGEFEQLASNHLRGAECPFCFNKNEGKVQDLLNRYFKNWSIVPHKKIWNTYKTYKHKRFCDFWLEKNGIKIIVEHDGIQHFEPVRFCGISLKRAMELFKVNQLKDKLDTMFCKEKNIVLHRIRYDEDKELSIKKLYQYIQTVI